MDPAPPVLSIRADAQLPYQQVITVIDMIQQRELSKISLIPGSTNNEGLQQSAAASGGRASRAGV